MSRRTGFRVEGDFDRVQARFHRMAVQGEDLRPAWPDVQDYLASVVRQQFASRGARLGTRWAPIDPAHAVRKPNPQPLVETGSLLRSFQGSGRNALKRRSKTRGEFGSKHPLAHLHHAGTNGGRLPARPILFPTTDINVRIREPCATT